jgi:hypothetical protein
MRKIALLFILLSSICLSALPNLIRITGCPTAFAAFNQLYYKSGATNYAGVTTVGYFISYSANRWALGYTGDYPVEIGIYSNACASSVSPTEAVWNNTGNQNYSYTSSVVVSGCTGNYTTANQSYAGTIHSSYFTGATDGDIYFHYGYNNSTEEVNWYLYDGAEYVCLLYQTTPVWNLLGTAWTEYTECGSPVVAPTNTVVSFVPVFESIDVAINSADELQAINTNAYTLAGNYVQTADIDLTSLDPFVMIGVAATPFTGTYDGGNLNISNLKITSAVAMYTGLFGFITAAVAGDCLKNMRIVDAHVSGVAYVGTLYGQLYTVNAGVGVYVRNCHVIDTTVAATGVGAGACLFGSTPNATGYAAAPTMIDCSATGTASSTSTSTAAICGGFSTGGLGNFVRCFATGTLTVHESSQTHGGFSGRSNGGSYTDCYARMTITGTTTKVGAFVGDLLTSNRTAIFSNCYGVVSGVDKFFGAASGGVSGATCYYEGTGTDNGATGKTAVGMKTRATFTGYNFASAWRMDTGGVFGYGSPFESITNGGYPYLYYQSSDGVFGNRNTPFGLGGSIFGN